MHPHNACPLCTKELNELEAYEILFRALRESAQDTLENLKRHGIRLVVEKNHKGG
jgi:hypothetical protein